MEDNKPTREQFRDYLRIQASGATNMFDVNRVCELSRTDLTRDICRYIMRRYKELCEEYNMSVW